MTAQLCACGCGEVLLAKPHHKYKPARFLPGHHLRLERKPHPTKYWPTPEETPSGYCECGCGQPTKIANYTVRARRHFKGYPMPYVRGHGSPKKGRKSRDDGRWIAHGYALLHKPDHPSATKNGTVREHRYVMEQVLGRQLRPDERVHHKNGDRLNNRPENLELWVTKDPPGQRVVDLVQFAHEILNRYEGEMRLFYDG